MDKLAFLKEQVTALRAEADRELYGPPTPSAINGLASAARSRAFKEVLDLIEIAELGLN